MSTKFVAMRCPHCGGVIEHKFGNLWHCPYCNTDSAFAATNEDDIEKVVVDVKHNGKICIYSVIKTLVIEARYRKRATAADKFPMDIVFNIDGREVTVAEEVENIGKGRISMEIRSSRVFFYSEGKIDFTVNDAKTSEGNLGLGDRFKLGSVNLLFRNYAGD